VDSSRATAQARGDGARSSAAAADHSRADAAAFGAGATSGAAADDHGFAFARALGPGSSARAAAPDHGRAFALAGPFSSADVAPGRAQCTGLAAGLDLPSGGACLGPVDGVHRPGKPSDHHEHGRHHRSGHHQH